MGDFSGVSAALAWNSSSIFIHSRNGLEIKPTEVASVYFSQSEIIHVLLSLVRSWGKPHAHVDTSLAHSTQASEIAPEIRI